MTPLPHLLSALTGAMRLDGLLSAAGPSAAARRTARLFDQISGQVSMGKAQGGPQDGAEVGLARPRVEGAEGPGGRAHPHRHFGDLCPGRQSQPLAQSRMGTQGDQEPDHVPPPDLGPLVLETQIPSPAQGQIPGTTCLPQQGSRLVGDCS